MKPFDTKGEYTPEEVKAALAGVDGTRQLSYRYERLDRNNKFVEEINYIQSCTIENNALADIKRTAKFDILDTGRINFLQDRIKPYVRLAMPADKDYNESVRDSNPDIWWRFDDTVVAARAMTAADIADGLTYSTRDTAFNLDLSVSDKSSSVKLIAGSGTLRSEVWFKTTVADSAALLFEAAPVGIHTGMNYEIYTSPTETDPLTLAFPLADDNPFTQYTDAKFHPFPFPVRGVYYFRLFTTATGTTQQFTLRSSRPKRLEDSSDNGFYAVGRAIGTGGAPVIGGGNSVAGYSTWSTSKINSPMKGGVVMNFWQFSDIDSPTYNGTNVYASYSTRDQDEWFLSWTLDHYDGGPAGYLSVSIGYWYGALEVPLDRMNGAHMWTISYEPDSVRPLCLYIDGEFIGELADQGSSITLTEAEADFDTSVLTGMDVQINSNTNVRVDDMTVFFRPVPTDQLISIYRDGIDLGSLNQRSGFVEWPLGVFVMSSPSRKMISGNSIVRSVEGYDQLIALKEGSFDYRFSVAGGTKYTDAVKNILATAPIPSPIPLTNELWSVKSGAVILNDTSATLFTSAPSALVDIVSTPGATTLAGTTLSAAITGTTDQNITMCVLDESGKRWGFVKFFSGVLTAMINDVNYTIATYSASAHKYWRFSEKDGIFYWEVSADGITWTLLRTELNPFAADSKASALLRSSTISGPSTVRMDEVSYAASKEVKAAIVDSASVLPVAMEWEPGTSKLSIINDLLGAINYESATYDEDGNFVGKPYVVPQSRSSEFRYATDSQSVLTGDVNQTVDLFGVPNKWVVVVSDPDRPALKGEYTNSNPLSPTSTVSRGRIIIDFRTEQNAADQTTLDSWAARLAFEASQVYEVIEFETALMPIHSNADVYDLIIDDLAVSSKYSEHTWSMELRNGATMKHKVRKVTTV